MTEEIRRLLLAVPFQPFTIYVADGREYAVPTPDHAHVHPKDLRVTIFSDHSRECTLPARQLSGVEVETVD